METHCPFPDARPSANSAVQGASFKVQGPSLVATLKLTSLHTSLASSLLAKITRKVHSLRGVIGPASGRLMIVGATSSTLPSLTNPSMIERTATFVNSSLIFSVSGVRERDREAHVSRRFDGATVL